MTNDETTRAAELKKEQEEVIRLRAELEKVKQDHRAEIVQVTEASQAEIRAAKEVFDKEKSQLGSDLRREREQFALLNDLTNKLWEANELLAQKMEIWKEMMNRLDHEMGGTVSIRISFFPSQVPLRIFFSYLF